MIEDFVNRVMLSFDTQERAAAQNAEYEDAVAPKLDRLIKAVQNAISTDRDEADSFWTELGRVMKHPLSFRSERQRFYDQANELIGQAETALTQVRTTCETQIKRHAGVPKQLDSDSEQWEKRRNQITQIEIRATALRDLEGWSGPARDGYAAAATVQINALQELAGVMESTGKGCRAGATLNRAIFFVVGKSIDRAAGKIESAPGGSGGSYYLRTVVARNECQAVISSLSQVVSGTVAAGSADNLASQVSKTMTMPNLLAPGSWPSGTTGVNITPANTSDGVTADGNDGDLSAPESGSSQSSPGVDL